MLEARRPEVSSGFSQTPSNPIKNAFGHRSPDVCRLIAVFLSGQDPFTFLPVRLPYCRIDPCAHSRIHVNH